MALTKILEEGIKDGEIVNADINASAAIAKTKLASLDIVNADINASAAIAKTKLASLDIVNADINASAAIARTKLANVDLVDDSSPQLGGTLDLNGYQISAGDSNGSTTNIVLLGANQDLQIYHDSNNSLVHNNAGSFIIENDSSNANSIFIKAKSGEHSIIANHNGAVELFWDHSKKFETTSSGVSVSGIQRNSTAGYNYLLIGSTDASGATLTLDGDSNGDGSGGDYAYIEHGTDGDLAIHCDNPAGDSQFELYVGNGSTQAIVAQAAGAVNLYHNGSQRFYTATTGAVVTAGNTTLSIVGTNSYAQLTLQTTAGNNNNYIQSDHGLVMWIDGANRAQFEPDGTFILKDGNIKIDTAGHGIDFSATSDASGNTSELLDDYEEGTWTPTALNHSETFSISNAEYVKVGNLVHVQMYVDFGSTSNGNTVRIGGLPFTAAGGTSNYSLLTSHTQGSISDFCLRSQGSTTTLTAVHLSGGNGDSKPFYSNFSSKFIIMGGTYKST